MKFFARKAKKPAKGKTTPDDLPPNTSQQPPPPLPPPTGIEAKKRQPRTCSAGVSTPVSIRVNCSKCGALLDYTVPAVTASEDLPSFDCAACGGKSSRRCSISSAASASLTQVWQQDAAAPAGAGAGAVAPSSRPLPPGPGPGALRVIGKMNIR